MRDVWISKLRNKAQFGMRDLLQEQHGPFKEFTLPDVLKDMNLGRSSYSSPPVSQSPKEQEEFKADCAHLPV